MLNYSTFKVGHIMEDSTTSAVLLYALTFDDTRSFTADLISRFCNDASSRAVNLSLSLRLFVCISATSYCK